jgi:hypothetical protein
MARNTLDGGILAPAAIVDGKISEEEYKRLNALPKQARGGKR